VLQPDVVEAFQRAGIDTQALGVVAHERYLNPDGSIAQPMPMRQMLTLGICCMALCGDIFRVHIGKTVERHPAGE